MATKQNDAGAMTEEQLDTVAGGLKKYMPRVVSFKIILPADPPVRENTFRTTNMLHDTAMA